MRTAVVFVGGPRTSNAVPAGLARSDGQRPDLVVAVDSGLDVAVEHGWEVDLVVGDMDSVDPDLLDVAVSRGARVQLHPVDKDATDLELALDALLAERVERAVLFASDAGRMDHLVGSLLTLCAPRFAPMELRAWLGGSLVVPVHDRTTIDAGVGQRLSILAVHGAATVRTSGLRWPLQRERLEPGTSRGLSNVMVAEVAEVSVDDGVVAVVLPEEEQEL
jgi:thiamine pyrophosphokinase